MRKWIKAIDRLPKSDTAVLGFLKIRYVETKVVPQLRAVRSGGVTDGETVVLIRAQ